MSGTFRDRGVCPGTKGHQDKENVENLHCEMRYLVHASHTVILPENLEKMGPL